MYKSPHTGHKMSIVTPHMSLGVAVHEVLEGLGDYPAEERMERNLFDDYEKAWSKVTGIKGGFKDEEDETVFKARGIAMLKTVESNPRFLPNKRIKLPRETMNPNFFLSDEENIILNGLVDWIEYLPETDSLHIIDFKTGKKEESESSLQLPIYLLLCNALQKRPVTRASYWYLESDSFIEKALPDPQAAFDAVFAVAKRVKDARVSNTLECVTGGCMHCDPYERILAKDSKDSIVQFVGVGGFNQDMYVLRK